MHYHGIYQIQQSSFVLSVFYHSHASFPSPFISQSFLSLPLDVTVTFHLRHDEHNLLNWYSMFLYTSILQSLSRACRLFVSNYYFLKEPVEKYIVGTRILCQPTSTSQSIPWTEAMSLGKRSIGSTKISSLSILMDDSDVMTSQSLFLNMN